jgi:uncharacterized membrane protein YeaQ/YmgE (transglycosylase-associated protein family)
MTDMDTMSGVDRIVGTIGSAITANTMNIGMVTSAVIPHITGEASATSARAINTGTHTRNPAATIIIGITGAATSAQRVKNKIDTEIA